MEQYNPSFIGDLYHYFSFYDMKKYCLSFLFWILLTFTVQAQSIDASSISDNNFLLPPNDSLQHKKAIGFAIDLLPPILSAATGHFGYSAQVWYGYKKNRIRGVVAGFQMPDQLMGNDDFTDLKTTATALIFDRFKKNNFKGWWLGTGFEFWNNTITSKTDNIKYNFNNYVATAGVGYIFKVRKNFYIEPWGAVHYVLNDEAVVVGISKYEPKQFKAEVSLKIGWVFKL